MGGNVVKKAFVIILMLLLTLSCAQGLAEGDPDPEGQETADGAIIPLNETGDDSPAEVTYGTLFADMASACAGGDALRIDADAAALGDELAASIAEQWKTVYMNPDYRLCLYGTDDPAELPVAGKHAFVVLGYALKDGEMTEELKGRCDAAAAAAQAFPDSILVCSGGATGDNNPEGHTEAGLMKEYLSERRGIAAERIFTDEQAMTTAENAVNTFAILREQGIEAITIITSSYHQRRGQALYNAMAARYRLEYGYSVEIVGNFCYDTEPSGESFLPDELITVMQMGAILELPDEQMGALMALMPGMDRPRAAVRFWRKDSPALMSIVSFVTAAADGTSDGYIPEKDRVAVFDFDGTLYGELFPTYFDTCLFIHRALHDPDYTAAQDVREYAEALEAALEQGLAEPDAPRSTAQMAAECFAGMTVEAYRDYVRAFMDTPASGFEGMTYGAGFYRPMVALAEYLENNGFTVFISSGSERTLVRALIDGVIDIPPYRVIGSTFALEASGQGDTAGRSYTYAPEDAVLLEGSLSVKNQKMNKVISAIDEIGQTPVLVFGNSTGDFALAQYAVQHGGKAYMLLCDDTERDYGDPEKAAAFAESCRALGFETVSMRDEFGTIYGEGVTLSEKATIKADPSAALPETDPASAENQADSGLGALDAIRERGTLRVGSTGDYNPMSWLDPDTGEYVGFDAELAEDLAKALGVEIEYVPTSWPTLTEDTLAKKFDLAICGITITDTRKEIMLMSEGYLVNGKTILCRTEDADRYLSLDDINRAEVRVMVNPGGLNEKFARENLPEATLIIHDVNDEIPGLVASGAADVMITEIMEAGYYTALDSRLAAPLIDEPFTQGQLGVLMPKGSEDLLDFVNGFIEAERESGRLDELSGAYIYGEEALAPAA